MMNVQQTIKDLTRTKDIIHQSIHKLEEIKTCYKAYSDYLIGIDRALYSHMKKQTKDLNITSANINKSGVKK